MNDHNIIDRSSKSDHMDLRRCIMLKLYEFFKEHPYASVELKSIENDCHSTVKEVNWNMVYLEKKGYVELSPSTDCFPFIACSVSISGKGIDLVEDVDRFKSTFPR